MYKLTSHAKLAKLVKETNLFKENEIVGAGDNVAGLEVVKYRLPDERGTVMESCLGGSVSGTKKR